VTEPPLVTPDLIETAAIHVLRTRHTEHLAAHERRRQLAPRTLEPLKRVGQLTDTGQLQSGDDLPAALLMVVGAAGEVEENESGGIDIPVTLALEVTVAGRSRGDARRRRDATGWTAAECLLQRLPRHPLLSTMSLVDFESLGIGDATRVLGRLRFLFRLMVPDMVSMQGLPHDEDPDWPAGTPGGPPPDGEPYEPPLPLPHASDLDADIDRAPIT